jgi:hypothetical protein
VLQGIVKKSLTYSNSWTIASGGSLITYTSTTANFYFISNVNTNIILRWTMNALHANPGSIKVVLPVGFTVLAGAFC